MSNTSKRFILRNSIIPDQIEPNAPFTLSRDEEDLMHQITSVYRCKAGDKLILMNHNTTRPENTEYHFQINNLNKKTLEMTLLETSRLQESPYNLTLSLCLPNKPAKLDFILEKATETGATSINLIKSDFSNFQHELRLDRLNKIVIEAAEQSERARVPTLQTFTSIGSFLESKPADLMIAMERSEKSKPFDKYQWEKTDYDILIGPEGGFSQQEREFIELSGHQQISLGKHILKQDTAVILALAIISTHQ